MRPVSSTIVSANTGPIPGTLFARLQLLAAARLRLDRCFDPVDLLVKRRLHRQIRLHGEPPPAVGLDTYELLLSEPLHLIAVDEVATVACHQILNRENVHCALAHELTALA